MNNLLNAPSLFALMLLLMFFSGASRAAVVPCAHMLTESGNPGDLLKANIVTCESNDAPVRSDSSEVNLRLRWFHPDSGKGEVSNEALYITDYVPGMLWSDLGELCYDSNKCSESVFTHSQNLPGQICVQVVSGNSFTGYGSPAKPSCVVVGNQCAWNMSDYSIEFPESEVGTLNGASISTEVIMQCGFSSDVVYRIRGNNPIELLEDGVNKISGLITLDDTPITPDGIKFKEIAGFNKHTLKATLNIQGKVHGRYTKSVVIEADYP